MSTATGFDPAQLAATRALQPSSTWTLAYHTDSPDHPKYTVTLLDLPPPQKLPVAVFIVPQGYETAYFYGSPEGIKELAETIGTQRLILVAIDPHYRVPTLDAVLPELQTLARQCIPAEFSGYSAQIMTASEGVGNRTLLFERRSDYNGTVYVEQTEEADGRVVRRLCFSGLRGVVQSEAVVVDGKLDVERSIRSSPYLDAIRRGMAFFWANQLELPFRVVVLGAGGCTLSLGIKRVFPEARIVNVDVDPVVVDAAKQYFFATHEETTAILTMNAIEYLDTLAHRAAESPLQNAVHCIVVDIDNKPDPAKPRQLTGPPPAFLSANTTRLMRKSLFSSNAASITPPLVIFNIVTRDPKLRTETVSDLKRYFPKIYVWVGDEDVNLVAFCFSNVPHAYDLSPSSAENKGFADLLAGLHEI